MRDNNVCKNNLGFRGEMYISLLYLNVCASLHEHVADAHIREDV